MPIIRSGIPALVLVVALTAAACSSSSGGSTATPTNQARTPETVVPVSSPQLGAPRINLETALSTTYYEAEGLTTEQIFASIEANGPTDDAGRQGSGLTSVEWEYQWTGEVTPSGECSIRELTVTADILVHLPRHFQAGSLSEALRQKWQAYADGVAEHEQRHVDIYLEGAETIKERLQAVGVVDSCEELAVEIDGIWSGEQAVINNRQEIFHSEEDADLAARRTPLAAQIEENRNELASLQEQISALDEDISRLRAEIAVFDNEVANIDAEVNQINDAFPNQLPETARQRLSQLVEQSNDLLEVYNQRVEEHNAAIHQRSALSDEHDRLITETNALVEEFNWTR